MKLAADTRGTGRQSRGVAEVDGVVVAVRVAVDLLGVSDVENRVDGDEAAVGRVVFAGSEVGEAGGGVVSAADEAAFGGPGGGFLAAGCAEGGCVASGVVEVVGADGELGGPLLVVDQVVEAAVVGLDDGGVGDSDVAGGGDLVGGLVELEFLPVQVEGHRVGLAAQEAAAVGVVEEGRALARDGGFGEVALGVPFEGLVTIGGHAADGVARLVVGEGVGPGSGAGDVDAGEGVGSGTSWGGVGGGALGLVALLVLRGLGELCPGEPAARGEGPLGVVEGSAGGRDELEVAG